MQSGTFTAYYAKECEPRVYEAGDAFVELPSTVHVGRNETSGTVQLATVSFNVPISENRRIDQPQPDGCQIT